MAFNRGNPAAVPSVKTSPKRLIVILVLLILAIEAAVMLFLHLVLSVFIGHGSVFELIIDPVLLTALLSPFLYVIVFRPMINAMNALKASEDSLRFEKEKVLNILEAMEDGVAIIGRDYDMEYANPALEKEFGQWQGIKCFSYLHDMTEVCPQCPNKRVFDGNTVRWEWYSPKNDKTYDLIDSPLKNPDNTISKLEIFRDISDKKAAETELKKRLDELERFQKATIGRELKIKELKERVKMLEDRMKGLNNNKPPHA